jgi:hypothetical protein
MDFSDKRGNLILEMQGHHSSMALENTIVVATNAHRFSNNFLKSQSTKFIDVCIIYPWKKIEVNCIV